MNFSLVTNYEMDRVEKLIAMERSCEYQCYRKILANLRRAISSGKYHDSQLNILLINEWYLSNEFDWNNI
jgi:hypothetical protein